MLFSGLFETVLRTLVSETTIGPDMNTFLILEINQIPVNDFKSSLAAEVYLTTEQYDIFEVLASTKGSSGFRQHTRATFITPSNIDISAADIGDYISTWDPVLGIYRIEYRPYYESIEMPLASKLRNLGADWRRRDEPKKPAVVKAKYTAVTQAVLAAAAAEKLSKAAGALKEKLVMKTAATAAATPKAFVMLKDKKALKPDTNVTENMTEEEIKSVLKPLVMNWADDDDEDWVPIVDVPALETSEETASQSTDFTAEDVPKPEQTRIEITDTPAPLSTTPVETTKTIYSAGVSQGEKTSGELISDPAVQALLRSLTTLGHLKTTNTPLEDKGAGADVGNSIFVQGFEANGCGRTPETSKFEENTTPQVSIPIAPQPSFGDLFPELNCPEATKMVTTVEAIGTDMEATTATSPAIGDKGSTLRVALPTTAGASTTPEAQMTEDHVRRMLAPAATSWADFDEDEEGWRPVDATDAYAVAENLRKARIVPKTTGENAVLMYSNVGGVYTVELEAGFLVPIVQTYVCAEESIMRWNPKFYPAPTHLRNSWTYPDDAEDLQLESPSDTGASTSHVRRSSQSSDGTSFSAEPGSPIRGEFAAESVGVVGEDSRTSDPNGESEVIASDGEAEAVAAIASPTTHGAAPCPRHPMWTAQAESSGRVPNAALAILRLKTKGLKKRRHNAPRTKPVVAAPPRAAPAAEEEQVEPTASPKTAAAVVSMGERAGPTAAVPATRRELTELWRRCTLAAPRATMKVSQLQLGRTITTAILPSRPIARCIEGPRSPSAAPPRAEFTSSITQAPQTAVSAPNVTISTRPPLFAGTTATPGAGFRSVSQECDAATGVAPPTTERQLEVVVFTSVRAVETTTSLSPAAGDSQPGSIGRETHAGAHCDSTAMDEAGMRTDFPGLEPKPNPLVAVAVPMEQPTEFEAAFEKELAKLIAQEKTVQPRSVDQKASVSRHHPPKPSHCKLNRMAARWMGYVVDNGHPKHIIPKISPAFPLDEKAQRVSAGMSVLVLGFAVFIAVISLPREG